VLSYEEGLRRVCEELRVEKQKQKLMLTCMRELEDRLQKYKLVSPYADDDISRVYVSADDQAQRRNDKMMSQLMKR